MICYFDEDGNLINIGEWDFDIAEIEGVMVNRNELPKGSYSEEREVKTMEDGSRALV